MIYCVLITHKYESCNNNYDIKNINLLLEKLGFIINYKKSQTNPSKRCKYLGFFLDSEKYSLNKFGFL